MSWEELKTTECEGCRMFDKSGWCTMHHIAVAYNDEGCREYEDRDNELEELEELDGLNGSNGLNGRQETRM